MLVDCLKNTRLGTTEKIAWVLVILCLHLLGALIYLVVVRRRCWNWHQGKICGKVTEMMSIAEAVIQELNAPPPEKQEQVLEFVDSLSGGAEPGERLSFFDTALSLKLKGPRDWATNFEEYTDGNKKDAL